MKRMLDFRSGNIREIRELPLVKVFPLKKDDLDAVFMNGDGILFKLENLFKDNSKLTVLYSTDSKYLKDFVIQNYDINITRAGLNNISQLIDVTDFFIKSSYYKEEKVVVFILLKP